MNRRFYPTLMLFVTALTSLCLVKPALLMADVDTDATPDVQVTLASGAYLSLGEPIVLHYQITNSTGQTLVSHLGVYDTEWYTLELTDALGRPAVSIPDTRPADPGGLHISAERFLPPGKGPEGYIVMARYFTLTHPGKYLITFRAHLRSAPFSADEASPHELKQALSTSGTVKTQVFAFPLTVTNTNTLRLKKTAEALRQQLIQEKQVSRIRMLDDALFSMPEAQAAPSWEALASNPAYTLLVAGELGRVNTPKAADMLAQMLRNPRLSPDEVTTVSQSLNEIYNNGNAPLKSHISGIAASFGISMPKKVTMPVAAD